MIENFPNMPSENNKEEEIENYQERRTREISVFLAEFKDGKEIFPFPGLDEEGYRYLKSEETSPGMANAFTTPIDVLIQRFQNEGMKVVLWDESGFLRMNIWILPGGSDDVVADSILPRYLNINNVTNERIRKLIDFDRQSNK